MSCEVGEQKAGKVGNFLVIRSPRTCSMVERKEHVFGAKSSEGNLI